MIPFDVAPRRIAVFQALFLGDLLCATPALRALRRRFTNAEITLVGLPWARELVDRLASVDRLDAFPGHPALPDVPSDPARTAAFLARIRDTRYDLTIQLHGSGPESNDIVAAFAARRSIGFGLPGDDRLDLILPWRDDEHEIRRWLRLVGALGAPTDDTSIDLAISAEDRRQARRLLAALPATPGPIVGLHAGSKLPSRRWPPERFAALGDALAARFGARIVLTGGGQERDLTQAIAAAMRVPPLDLAGRTDLGTLAALVGRLDLLVTNDTGASHVAAATRTRSIVLFGPSRPGRWAPLDTAAHTAIDAIAYLPAGGERETALAHLPLRPVLAAAEDALSRPALRPTSSPVSMESAWPA